MSMKKIVFGLVIMFFASTTTLMAQDAGEAVKKKKIPNKKGNAPASVHLIDTIIKPFDAG